MGFKVLPSCFVFNGFTTLQYFYIKRKNYPEIIVSKIRKVIAVVYTTNHIRSKAYLNFKRGLIVVIFNILQIKIIEG